MMSVYRVKDLPVVAEDQLAGMVSEESVSSVDPDTLLSEIELNKVYVFVREEDHVFEVLGRLAQNNMTVVPVVDNEDKFKGLITQEDMIKYYANSYSFKEPGSIIVIETTKKGYSLSEVSRVIELENAHIISSFITSRPDSEESMLTIKVNQQEISHIISALERYDYKIQGSYVEDEYSDDLQDRYNMLMNYLNV